MFGVGPHTPLMMALAPRRLLPAARAGQNRQEAARATGDTAHND